MAQLETLELRECWFVGRKLIVKRLVDINAETVDLPVIKPLGTALWCARSIEQTYKVLTFEKMIFRISDFKGIKTGYVYIERGYSHRLALQQLRHFLFVREVIG